MKKLIDESIETNRQRIVSNFIDMAYGRNCVVCGYRLNTTLECRPNLNKDITFGVKRRCMNCKSVEWMTQSVIDCYFNKNGDFDLPNLSK